MTIENLLELNINKKHFLELFLAITYILVAIFKIKLLNNGFVSFRLKRKF